MALLETKTSREIIENVNPSYKVREYLDTIWVKKEDYDKREIELKYQKCPLHTKIETIFEIINHFNITIKSHNVITKWVSNHECNNDFDANYREGIDPCPMYGVVHLSNSCPPLEDVTPEVVKENQENTR